METYRDKNTQTPAHKHSTPQSRLLEIERTFSAPVSDVFDAFRNPETLKVWWWPKGLYADRVDLNFREGGNYFFNMLGFDRGGGGMTGQFEEIVENERIVMTDQFADENGRAISAQEAKMPGDWPEICYVTFEFESLGDNTCRLHLSQEGIPNELHAECIQGWNESFDKLDTYLTGMRQ